MFLFQNDKNGFVFIFMSEVMDINAYTYKMVVLGHYSVGKSSIVLNFVKNEFNSNEESTIGAAFLTKTIFLRGNAIKFEIWDTAGQERYYSLIPMYYRGANVALIVYDVTSQESFETAKKWVEDLKIEKPDNFLKVLVGNKIDLDQEMVVSEELVREYAQKENLLYYLTSAKTGINIKEVFTKIAELLPKDQRNDSKADQCLKKKETGFFCC
ncbi:hypothetical protein NUSPORA_01556 [Nucleospora cyclopteri]